MCCFFAHYEEYPQVTKNVYKKPMKNRRKKTKRNH